MIGVVQSVTKVTATLHGGNCFRLALPYLTASKPQSGRVCVFDLDGFGFNGTKHRSICGE